MKKCLLIFLFSTLYSHAQNTSSIDTLFSKQLEHKLISKGDNFPDFWTAKDSMDYLLFATHKNIPVTSFADKTKFSNTKINNILSFLESKNWVSVVDDKYKPTVFIASSEDGKKIYKYSTPISHDIALAIEKMLPQIKKQFSKTDMAKHSSFQNWAFLILSNVLLDSWQIDNVERDFLMKEDRPLRHGRNYYYGILEKTNKHQESFGIYGNQQMNSKDGSMLSVYGNNRLNKNGEEYDSNIISKKDNVILKEMTISFLPELLFVLENYRTYSEDVYKELGYSSEITFEEFYIWFYHFIYTQSTDELAAKQLLEIPSNGNFYYQILP